MATRVSAQLLFALSALLLCVARIVLSSGGGANLLNAAALEAAIRQQQQLNQKSQEPQEQQNAWWNSMYYEPVYDGNYLPSLIDAEEAEALATATAQNVEHLQQEFGDVTSTDGGADDDENENSFFELSPKIGQTAGLALDADNHLVLFHRSSRVWDEYSFTPDNKMNSSFGAIKNATIAVLDSHTGKLLAEHGANHFYMPHGMTIDADGNYWLTDVGSHQVIKLNKKFELVMELGEKLVPGSDEKHFCKPTDVAVAKNGDFFVADGYCNSRIMKFNKDGKFITSFGAPNSQTPPHIGEFSVPHSLALIEDLNLLCVADRENKRIQCFAAGLSEGAHFHPRAFVPTGTFFTKAENIGRVFAIREKHHYLVGVTNQDESGQVDSQVFVMDMNTGRANTFAKGLENAHALALSEQGDIFISQINPNQIVKFSVPTEF